MSGTSLFEQNVGDADRIVRAGIGIFLIILAIAVEVDMLVKGLLVLVGIVFLFTAIVRVCLLYRLLGINTMKK